MVLGIQCQIRPTASKRRTRVANANTEVRCRAFLRPFEAAMPAPLSLHVRATRTNGEAFAICTRQATVVATNRLR